MIKKMICIFSALVLLLGVMVAYLLNFNGLLAFVHPLKTAEEGQIKVACVGDSVTYGFGIKNRAKNNYPAVLQTLLGDECCVNNYGFSGRTVSHEGDRPYSAENLFQKSLDFQPDIVVLMLGSNDSKPFNWNKELFDEDYRAIVKSYQTLESHPQVYIVIPTPVFPVNGKVKYNIDGNVLQNEIVPLTRRLAETLGLPVIDMNEAFAGRENLFSDGCHPNKDGALLYAQVVKHAILQGRTAAVAS